MTTSVNNSIPSHPAINPAFLGGYVFSDHQTPGVVAATNHLSLYNPVGSGRVITLTGVFISSYTVGAVPEVAPLRGWLATGVSGGTLEPSSAIGKLRSTMPSTVAEVRTGNPTATLGAAWFNSPAIQATGVASAAFIHQVPASTPSGPVTLLPGEGTVIRTESGDTNQRWNLSVVWNES